MSLVILKKKKLNNLLNKKSIKNLRKYIFKEKKIVVIKNIHKNLSVKLVNQAEKQLKKKPRFFKPFLNCLDQYIFNKNNKKSKVRGYYKKIVLFPWNKENLNFFNSMNNLIRLKERINIQKNKNVKKKYHVIQIMNYPAKKGFLSKHKDSNFHKECIIQIGTKQKNHKSEDSGLNIFSNFKNINIDKFIRAGDLILFSKGIKHFVKQDSARSRWSIILGDFF